MPDVGTGPTASSPAPRLLIQAPVASDVQIRALNSVAPSFHHEWIGDTCWGHWASVICHDSRLGWMSRQIFFFFT